jgi:hypothetical protein
VRYLRIPIATVLACVLALAGSQVMAQQSTPADTVFVNGTILTGEPHRPDADHKNNRRFAGRIFVIGVDVLQLTQ